ncbi:MAG: class I SAM-dependent methyltransferase [Thermomicrobiales bacterium]|nr:MAG: class I SAM-dependent methyltransferase [Thermomicrobiales bacterium]
MNHDDHVHLIAAGIAHPGGLWADFGAGWGAFTLAMRELTGPEGEILALDRDWSALGSLRERMIEQYPGTSLFLIYGDLCHPQEMPPLDGIVAANPLHYVDRTQQAATLQRWSGLLKPDGCIVLVEYDTSRSSSWLPYPISFQRLGQIAREAGLPDPRLLATHPSQWGEGIYSAAMEMITSKSGRQLG